MDTSIFRGCMPALMTPVDADGAPAYDVLVRKGLELMVAGMSGVVYCGSMGEWPLLSDAQRQEGVRRLVEAGVPVVVGTGAQSPAAAAAHAAHAREVGAAGLMVIPRVLSRGTSQRAQREHIARVLATFENDKAATAEALGIGLSSLYRKLDELGISKTTDESARAS